MAPLQSRTESHEKREQKAASLLAQACQTAKDKQNYDSSLTQRKIVEEFRARFNNLVPYDWQLNVTEALMLGLDCSVIVGTGAGKTMPFVMPLFAQPNKHVLIISPLNTLEEDQAQRFRKMGLSAVAVNGETYNSQVHQDILSGNYQVILTSPEMCLLHDSFRKLLSDAKLSSMLTAVVVDEAHCISQWGTKFRPEYAKLGTLRALMPTQVPFLITSATLPPLVLADVQTKVHIQTSTSYHVDVGTDRPNISWEVRRMKAAKSDLESLRFMLPKSCGGEGKEDKLTSTLVFSEDISLLMEATEWCRRQVAPELRNQIVCYHSRRTPLAKRIALRLFREGKIKILFTTEAAGMGCDMPHIELVVQFLVPGSLSIWMQRAGRAGRSPSVQARAVLLVQPMVFQMKTSKKAGKDPDQCEKSIEYIKNVDDALRAWIEAKECRREVVDVYFGSGLPLVFAATTVTPDTPFPFLLNALLHLLIVHSPIPAALL
ncbi:hypothetical protein PAXINDRAFT_12087 [Paxillus involutus ATCC 200175]|uniref:DNA 3'-5' helicase n=1 Tax=Paxillus involutus ATCC 200175 TaxID=664439 RepID=A0A0C9TY39_PAXIN|nr:hypothetical protein PAXINDRAFT_12087 [Paxillus involutus ATCC 200175]